MRNDNPSPGKASLWTSIVGIVLLASLVVLLVVDILYLTPYTRM